MSSKPHVISLCHCKALRRFRASWHPTWCWKCGIRAQPEVMKGRHYNWSVRVIKLMKLWEGNSNQLSWTHWVLKKKIISLPCLKVYIMLFPKHNSNASAHQVILKSLKANCHYSFRRDAVRFQVLHFGWVIWIWQICFKILFVLHGLEPSISICNRDGPYYFAYDHLNYARYLPE